MQAIYTTATGALVSVGTVVADPLPVGLSQVTLTSTQAADLQSGKGTWDPATRTVIPTPGWVDPAIAEGNRATIEQQATTALIANTTYLAIASPTNAQVAAQVKDLTRQMNKVIRLVLNKLDGTD